MPSAKSGLWRIVVADEDSRWRRTTCDLLARSKQFELVGIYDEPFSLLEGVRRTDPDLVVTEMSFAEWNGPSLVEQIKGLRLKVQILVLTEVDSPGTIFRALQNGAGGYCLKKDLLLNLEHCVLDLMGGGAPMSRFVARKVVEFMQYGLPLAEPHPASNLTYRERQIMHAIVAGLTCPQIAKEFGISESTVKTHLRQVYQKWQVHTRAEAVLKFVENIHT